MFVFNPPGDSKRAPKVEKNHVQQCFPNFNMHRNYLEILLKPSELLLNADSDSVDVWWGLRVCTSKKLPGEAEATGPGATP